MGVKALNQNVDTQKTQENSALQNGLLWGFYLAVFNPVAFAFWPGIFASSVEDISSVNFVDFAQNLFILVGVLIWGAILSLIASLGKASLNQKTANFITKGSGILLLFFSGKMLYDFVSKFS